MLFTFIRENSEGQPSRQEEHMSNLFTFKSDLKTLRV